MTTIGGFAPPATLLGWRNGGRSIDVAARSLCESQVLAGSVASVILEGAFEHYRLGLFEHAAIRHGIPAAGQAIGWLDAQAESLLAARGESTPGTCLYRALRAFMAEFPLEPLAPNAEAWWSPLEEDRKEKLVRARTALSQPQADAIELCFSRGLDLSEAAAVLDVSEEAIAARVADGLAAVSRIFGRSGGEEDQQRDAALLALFALDSVHARAPARSARPPGLAIGTVLNERYELEATLGAGAFADVYRARDREVSDHVVAVKILRRPARDPRAVRAALRELQLIASVFHPSIVQLKDHGWHQGQLWFVMPLYRGETLAARLERGPLERQEARRIFEPLAEALAIMHRVGVRHQDIKPENVFLANIDPEGDGPSPRVLPVLLDLGVAAKDAELMLAGTPAYFAPEVAARFASVPDPAPVGPKADVFSLALTLRHSLEPGAASFSGRGVVDAFVNFRATHAPRPPQRRELKDLRPHFERWLHLSPDERPSADEFRRELAVLTRPEERRARRLRFMRWAVPMAVTVGAIFSTVIYVLSREASVQRIEALEERLQAERAREHAASINAVLEEESARRKRLEADVKRLDEQYQSSKLTREQLAQRLAAVEGESSVLAERENGQVAKLQKQQEDLQQAHDHAEKLLAELDGTRARRDRLAADLDRLKAQLESERARRAELEAELSSNQDKLRDAEALVSDVRSRVNDMKRGLGVALGGSAGAGKDGVPAGPHGSEAPPKAPASEKLEHGTENAPAAAPKADGATSRVAPAAHAANATAEHTSDGAAHAASANAPAANAPAPHAQGRAGTNAAAETAPAAPGAK